MLGCFERAGLVLVAWILPIFPVSPLRGEILAYGSAAYAVDSFAQCRNCGMYLAGFLGGFLSAPILAAAAKSAFATEVI
ncbi:MAG: hypothetical protein BGP25_00175 [Lysobacterales bacterium 63-13]|nr:MAG: hypothetical protein BGP25_00175 [Xanthomonadales bacterium 63-13]